ncbi:DUF4369 domain-containing protein [Psychroflexus aestuariivivens]|uniref:DUF4369 domain-containing protein n=1 Tax=Psychroflexus aestuariivivens TaxID=1795040 RepID=UPI000FD80571|nr:DUF4369 domain-containing protein [Psychroflexus aestuariivivens]
MKNIFCFVCIAALLFACQSEKTNLTINGEIEGLKKGKLYLQKVVDTNLVDIDSIEISGESNFVFETYIEEPQILFIELDKKDGDNYEDILSFFAEPGEMKLKTSLKRFGIDLEIISNFENQQKYDEFRITIKRFNNQHLDLVEANFEAGKNNNEEKLDSINKAYNNVLKRKYLYTVNFAINNKDLEVAPYVILSEAFDANVKYLDTVYNSLDRKVRKSLYGEKLEDLIKSRKKLENKEENTLETETIETTKDSIV